MPYTSMDAFAELPPGTKFRHQFIDATEEPPRTYSRVLMKLEPTGGDIGSCNLVDLIDGSICHAVELWDMHELKQEENPYAHPEICVKQYAWEQDLVPDTAYMPLWMQKAENLEEALRLLGIDVPTEPDRTVFFTTDDAGTVYYCSPQETMDFDSINEFLRSLDDEEPTEGL